MMDRTPDQTRLVKLSPPDADALDALLESAAAGDAHAQQAAQQEPRGKKVADLLDLIGFLPGDVPPEDLVARTLAKVQLAERKEAVVGRIDPPAPPAIAFRWTEMIAVAAVKLIAMSLLWPMMARTQSDGMRIACAANLATSGLAMSQYARDNSSMLPRYRVQPGQIWWNVGQPVAQGPDATLTVQSNSANLYKLRREGYASVGALNCPANAEAPTQIAISAFDWPNPRAVSYSYQNQYSAEPIRVGRVAGIVLLADKNPLFTPDENSTSLTFDSTRDLNAPGNRHAQPGQSVLVIDGSVLWLERPMLNNDNFYTALGVNSYNGTETPTKLEDSFVVP
ncbi:MAG: hypothetical protein WD768_20845 [Phycisphaeraceae bacterium]